MNTLLLQYSDHNYGNLYIAALIMKYLHFTFIILLFLISIQPAFSAGKVTAVERSSIIELENRLAEKENEINELKQELANERSQNSNNAGFLSAGFSSSPAALIYMLLFSIAVGVISTMVVKRRTHSLCHCLNRRKKLLKKQKMLEKQVVS